MVNLKFISLNICNDDDLIYGSNYLNLNDIINFINYYNITDSNLINDLNNLLDKDLTNESSILHNDILSYHIHDNHIRSIKIKINNTIRYINNLKPDIVDLYLRNKKDILYKNLLNSNADIILLQNVDDHYLINEDDIENYKIIYPKKVENRNKLIYFSLLSNVILYKDNLKLKDAYISDYGTVGEFIFNNKIYQIISGKWDRNYIKLDLLNSLNNETNNIIFIGNTNIRFNQPFQNRKIHDGILQSNLIPFNTVNKYINPYFIDDTYKYVSRYDKIYLNKGKVLYANIYFKFKFKELINEYRPSGYISDHFGINCEIKLD